VSNTSKTTPRISMTVDQHDELLTTKEAGRLLTLTPSYLAALRSRREGPRFIKVGRRVVRYRRADLLAWLDEHTRGSTNT
jgi:predicted DNA-binding transcriptional regulator AlpA